MADNGNSGGNTMLALIVGGLLVVVLLFFVFGGFPGGDNDGPEINIAPKVSETVK
jgi:hypothetical protein